MKAVAVVVVLSLLLLPGLFLLYWPTCLSGGYIEITFTSITVEPNGRVALIYDKTHAYGAVEEWVSMPGSDGHASSSSVGWSNFEGRFPRWPRRINGGDRWIWLTTYGGTPDLETLRRRLLIRTGVPYRIRSGESMVYCRETFSDGRVAEGTIRVTPEP